MDELTKYESIQELKATSKPLDPNSAQSKERHDRFERFINFLKQGTVKYPSLTLTNGNGDECDR